MSTALRQKYKDLILSPESCEPLVQVYFPVSHRYSLMETLQDPAKMLANQLETIEARRKAGDDFVPALRVDFGTAQIAALFGCPIQVSEINEPCCGAAAIDSMEGVASLPEPSMEGGWMPKLKEFQDYFLKNKPVDIPIQHPDIQGPINTAHLIRGNDILYDFYDYPEETRMLLKKVTDCMIQWLDTVTDGVAEDDQWVFDRGGVWKGRARLCNCTLQLISPAIYKEFIQQEDDRFLGAVGGGRVHYCGSMKGVIPYLLELKHMTNLELDCQYHDITEISEMAPTELPLIFCDWSNDPGNSGWFDKIMRGEIPRKRNIVIQAKADNLEDAKRVYDLLKNKLCR